MNRIGAVSARAARPREALLAAAAIVAFTLFVTWPQCLNMWTRVASHDDPLFSIWRLAWIAHALAHDPHHLFDANIFHPVKGTLAFSDAMMLEGALAAPLLWANVSPILVYNLFLLGGIALSGMAMFVLARHLLGAAVPALVSAAIFTMAPYRIEHFMHLELQWTMWIPLAFWAYHRAIDEGSWRFGVLGGLLVWLQILTSVYYGVFLAIAVALFVPMLMALYPRKAAAALPGLAAGLLVAVVLTIPYALPYLRNADALGPRAIDEVAAYSARPLDYLASPPQNRLWGWTARRGGAERNLFPGALAIGLAAAAVAHRPRRLVIAYAALAMLAIELSFGLNGRVYAWLFDRVDALHGFRSPSRFAIIACCAVAMLAGFGFHALIRRLAAARAIASLGVTGLTFLMLAAEYSNTGMILAPVPYDEPNVYNVYKAVRTAGPGAVLELPLPRLDRLPGREAHYQLSSIVHWHPLVNGYSGYYPRQYLETVVRLESFPDDRSLAQLKNLAVRYIIIHRAAYEAAEYVNLTTRMLARPELRPYGSYPAFDGPADLFLLEL